MDMGIWVGIIGLILSIISISWSIFWTTKGVTIMKNIEERKAKKRNAQSEQPDISGEWQSVFIEGNKICHETLSLEQTGANIKANIVMPDKTYSFTGLFTRDILKGNYNTLTESGENGKEWGSIFLKHISDDILSGHCIFIYNDKEIYNSPYVWIKNMDITKGTYPFCRSCVNNSKCCCANKKIDMPILMPHEVDKISVEEGMAKDKFCEKKSNNIYQMKRKNNRCIFFKNNKCSIYEYRPIDCRLFPFDIQFKDGAYRVGYYQNSCAQIPSDHEMMKLYSHHIKPLIALMMPYLSESVNPELFPKISASEFEFREIDPIDNSLKPYY